MLVNAHIYFTHHAIERFHKRAPKRFKQVMLGCVQASRLPSKREAKRIRNKCKRHKRLTYPYSQYVYVLYERMVFIMKIVGKMQFVVITVFIL